MQRAAENLSYGSRTLQTTKGSATLWNPTQAVRMYQLEERNLTSPLGERLASFLFLQIGTDLSDQLAADGQKQLHQRAYEKDGANSAYTQHTAQ